MHSTTTAHKQEFHKSSFHIGSVLRSTIRMAAAGWIIDKMKLVDPMHRAIAFGIAGAGVGWVEGLMKERKEKSRPPLPESGQSKTFHG